MNTTNLGHIIATLRKKMGITQGELAEQLRVSNKAVSKWENGGGYPEITLLPRLSEVLGVSIDYLLKGDVRGIAVAGTIIADIVHMLDKFPEKNMLANILSSSIAVGGCVSNTIIDLAKIDSDIFLNAIGKIGDDENGRYVIAQMKKYGIDVSRVKVDAKSVTACTNVMTDSRTAERTFFYTGGANATFGIEDIDIDSLDCKLFHVGYILLLDELDSGDDQYQTKMARLLDMVSKRGIKTSIDVVSEDSNRFVEKVVPALKYTDYAIVNEIESCKVSGLSPYREDGSIHVDNIRKTMEQFMAYGVREKVIVHCADGGFLLDKDGGFYTSGSYRLPEGYIKGSVGAGDAYAAGCLYGIYKGFAPEYMLDFAAAAAALSLSGADSISGMGSRREIEELMNTCQKRKLV